MRGRRVRDAQGRLPSERPDVRWRPPSGEWVILSMLESVDEMPPSSRPDITVKPSSSGEELARRIMTLAFERAGEGASLASLVRCVTDEEIIMEAIRDEPNADR